MGRSREAVPLLRDALITFEAVYGPDGDPTKATTELLAEVTGGEGRQGHPRWKAAGRRGAAGGTAAW